MGRLGRVQGEADDQDQSVVEVRKVEITEGQIIRWLCYAGFFVCAVFAVYNMSVPGGVWLGFLLGSVIFGFPALKMYLKYQDYERQLAEQSRWQQDNGGRAPGGRRFDFGDGK